MRRVPRERADQSNCRMNAVSTTPSVPLYGEQTRLAIANFDIADKEFLVRFCAHWEPSRQPRPW
jgi:hypothetical protein